MTFVVGGPFVHNGAAAASDAAAASAAVRQGCVAGLRCRLVMMLRAGRLRS